MRESLSRRRMLEATLAGGVTATAGCFGFDPLGGGGGYTQWTPEPSELGNGDHYQVAVGNLTTVRDNEESFDGDVYGNFENLEDRIDPTGVDFDEMETFSTFSNGLVVTGSFEGVGEELERDDYEVAEDADGYTYYVPGGEDAAGECYAVGDLLIRAGQTDDDALERAEAVVETNAGEEDRYTDTNEAFAALANAIGSPTFGAIRTYERSTEDAPENGSIEDSVGRAGAVTVTGDTAEYTAAVAYEEADDVDTDDVEAFAELEFFDPIDDVSVSQDGAAAVISGRVDTDEPNLLSLVQFL